MRNADESSLGTTVLIHAPQAQFTFAIATAIFDEFGLSIADARIIPLATNQSLSLYTVLEQDGRAIRDDMRRDKVLRRLESAVTSGDETPVEITRKVPRQARMFSTPVQIEFATDPMNQQTIMDLTAGDRPGLLAEASNVMRGQEVLLRMAKIVTVGERAEDVFYITTHDGNPLSEAQQNDLREALLNAFDSQS